MVETWAGGNETGQHILVSESPQGLRGYALAHNT